jgi:cytidylate kinase
LVGRCGGSALATGTPGEEDDVRRQTEEAIRSAADTTGAVILGRAAAFVLGDRPDVLHVRLDGPVETRCERAATYEKVSLEVARQRRRDTDTARSLYVRHLYDARWDDPTAYHLVIDSTALPIPTCVDLIIAAATSRFASTSSKVPA